MRKGRTRNRILIVFGVTIFSLVLGLIFLPMPVARYLVAGQLNELGIVHKGFDSLEIDLWNQEIKVGPLAFQRENAARSDRPVFA